MSLSREIETKGSSELVKVFRIIGSDSLDYRNTVSKFNILKCNYRIIREFEEIHDTYYDSMR